MTRSSPRPRQSTPGPRRPLAEIEAALQQLTGLKLRDEILAPLGSRIVVYTVPTKINAPTEYAGRLGTRDDLYPEVDDRDRGQGSRGGGQGPGCTRQAVRAGCASHAQSRDGVLRSHAQPGSHASTQGARRGVFHRAVLHDDPLPGGDAPNGAGRSKGARAGLVAGDRAPRPGPDRSVERRRSAAWRPAGRRPRPAPRSLDLPQRQRHAAIDASRRARQPAELDRLADVTARARLFPFLRAGPAVMVAPGPSGSGRGARP